jgi:glutamine cyclotransferase
MHRNMPPAFAAAAFPAGMYGESTMRLTQVDDGKVLTNTPMASQWFGEGATRLGDKLYQITWLSGAGFIYSVPDLKQVRCAAATRE